MLHVCECNVEIPAMEGFNFAYFACKKLLLYTHYHLVAAAATDTDVSCCCFCCTCLCYAGDNDQFE